MLSIFRTIEVDVSKFFSSLESSAGKFCAAFVRLFKKAPQAEQVVQNFVDEAAPIIAGAVALADPVLEPEVAAGLATVETALAAIQASLSAANSGTSLLTNIENFAASVPQLLTGLAIKNADLKATVMRIVNLVAGEGKVLIPAVEAWVKQLAANAAVGGSAQAGA